MECSNPKPSFSKWRIIKNLVAISASFMFLFAAFDGLGMLQTTMNRKGGVGTASQAVLYMSSGTSSLLFSSFSIKKIGTKNAQVLGTILFLPFISSNFYPSWFTLVPSAIILGFGSSLLWAAQCSYFNEVSVLYRDLKDTSKNNNYALSCKATHASSKDRTEGLSAVDLQQSSVKTNQDVPQKKSNNSFESPSTLHLFLYRYVCCQMPETRLAEKSGNGCEKVFAAETAECPKQSSNLKCYQITKVKENDANKLHANNGIDKKHDEKSNSLSSINALFFSFHGLALCLAQVFSNLLSFYVLNSGQVDNYNKTSHCSCGASFCNTDQACVRARIEKVPKDVRYYYTSLCVASGLVAVLVIWLFVDHLHKPQEHVTLSKRHIIATIKYVKNKEQIFIMPLTILVSMSQGFYVADFTKSYIACIWSTSHIGLVSAFFGLVSSISAIISGLLIRLFGRRIILTVCQFINLVFLVLLYLWNPKPDQTIFLCLAAGTFGFVFGIFRSQTRALYGIFFQGDEETAFSSCNLYSSIGFALPFIYSEFFCTSVKIIIVFMTSCLGLVGYLLAERSFSLWNKERDSK